MPKTWVYIVSDETEVIEKAKAHFGTQAGGFATVNVYSPTQWRDGLESQSFRGQLAAGLPALVTGVNPLDQKSNILPFPGTSSPGADAQRMATMDEIESKAIENAIMQFRGNLTEAAKALGIGRATLYRKVKQYQIDPGLARKKRAA